MTDRREFLALAAEGVAGVFLAGCVSGSHASRSRMPLIAETGVPVTPTEDLMREHGVLRRILLIHEELLRRLAAGEPAPADILLGSAQIIRTVIEDYHEKNEEDYLFPRFERAGKLADLVAVLRAQHKAGRQVTSRVMELADAAKLREAGARAEVAGLLDAFRRMYRPHASREDTVLFPAFRDVVTPAEFDEIGDRFEDAEAERLGPGGFERTVERIAGMEKTLGIYDLAQFTPKTG